MVQVDAASKDVVTENAELIHRVVMAIAAEEHLPQLQMILAQAEANGWTSLVAAIRRILAGERDLSNLAALDEEDRTIVSAILQGVEDPSSLPDLANTMDPAIAGPSMANMIHDAVTGNNAAISAIAGVSGQMSSAKSGDFSQLPAAIDLMVTGERREEVLCRDMGAAGTSLVHAILEELKKLEA
jgi:hypothetical protein